MPKSYSTTEEVLVDARKILNKCLRDIISSEDIEEINKKIGEYGLRRKGYLGNLVEKYVFGLEANSRSEADFDIPGLELKTTPLKRHSKNGYVSKERLVFSMIDYKAIVNENWESSTFLKKNRLLLLMFYLYELEKTVIDYEFKYIHLLDLLGDISSQDAVQIKNDWEYIVAKIRRGEAHLLSEGETYYLGACTKAANSDVVRDQPNAQVQAKPRAFSLKQQYLNYLIHNIVMNRQPDAESMASGRDEMKTIETIVSERFAPYLGKTDEEIISMLGIDLGKAPKNYKSLLAHRILGVKGGKIAELEKSNVTLKVVTLEPTGTLKESISFPYFDYEKIAATAWDESEFYELLDSNRFLFVIFQKLKGTENIVLKKVKFWNFPALDLPEAESVFDKTIECIRVGRYADLPKISENRVAHVRPHGRDGMDKIKTPQGTMEMKRCFWLNAKYVQKALED
jgi:DNA mismatch repair endonuclease MutH